LILSPFPQGKTKGISISSPSSFLQKFYTDPKKIGSLGLALSFAATWIGATSTKGAMDSYASKGLEGLWLIAIPSVVTMVLVTFFLAKRVQKNPSLTQPEAIGVHFGDVGRVFLAGIIMMASTTTLASQLVASRHLLQGMIGEWADALTTGLLAVVTTYSMFGGFFAVAFTDILQSGLMFIALGSLFGFVVWAFMQQPDVFVSGWTSMPEGYWSLWTNPKNAIGLLITFSLAWAIAPEMWQRMKACKDEASAQKTAGMACLFIVGISLMVFGIGLGAAGTLAHAGTAHQGETNVYLWLTQALPFKAWKALVLLGFISAVTSTMDSVMNVASQSLVYDVVKRYILPKAEWSQLRWINYGWLILQGVLGLWIAFRLDDLIQVLWLSADIYACTMLVPVVSVLFHKTPHRLGGQLAMLGGGLFVGMTTLAQYTSLPLDWWPAWPFSTVYGMMWSLALYATACLAFPTKRA